MAIIEPIGRGDDPQVCSTVTHNNCCPSRRQPSMVFNTRISILSMVSSFTSVYCYDALNGLNSLIAMVNLHYSPGICGILLAAGQGTRFAEQRPAKHKLLQAMPHHRAAQQASSLPSASPSAVPPL